MKIAFVRMMPYPHTIGGGTSHLRDLSRALTEEGHEVHIISAKPEKRVIGTDESAKIHNVGMRHKKFSGKLLLLPFEAARRLFFELSFMISSYRLVKKLNPDIIHCQTILTESFPFALIGKKFIVTEHGLHIKGMKELYKKKKNPISKIGIWFYSIMERFNARRVWKIITIKKEAVRYYDRLTGKSCELVDNGIFLDKKWQKKGKRIYFTLSRLSPEKGLDYLIDALSILDKRGVKLEFWIAGEGEKNYVAELKKRASLLNNIKVRFLGLVVGDSKRKVLKNGAIFVIPSLFEGFPVTLLEAMANSCAIIASDCEGLKDRVRSSFGASVDFGSERKRAENLAEAIRKSMKWDMNKMGRAARKEVEKYDYREIVKKYIKIYREFIAQYGRKQME